MPDQVQQIISELERLAERTIQAITLDLTSNLIETTPVDTGWARANWIPSVTAPVQDTDGSPGNVQTGQQRAGQAQVLGYRLANGRTFVTNNVPYILRLNDGSSTQAPRGFVEAAIRKALTRDLTSLATA